MKAPSLCVGTAASAGAAMPACGALPSEKRVRSGKVSMRGIAIFVSDASNWFHTHASEPSCVSATDCAPCPSLASPKMSAAVPSSWRRKSTALCVPRLMSSWPRPPSTSAMAAGFAIERPEKRSSNGLSTDGGAALPPALAATGAMASTNAPPLLTLVLVTAGVGTTTVLVATFTSVTAGTTAPSSVGQPE